MNNISKIKIPEQLKQIFKLRMRLDTININGYIRVGT